MLCACAAAIKFLSDGVPRAMNAFPFALPCKVAVLTTGNRGASGNNVESEADSSFAAKTLQACSDEEHASFTQVSMGIRAWHAA